MQTTGLQLRVDTRDVYKDQILAGGEPKILQNTNFSKLMRKEFQGYKTFCTAYSTTKVADVLYKKDSSQDALALMTNTNAVGNTTNNVFAFVKNRGTVKQSDFPDISLETWNQIKYLGQAVKDQVPSSVYAKLEMLKSFGYLRLNTDKQVLMQELQDHPVVAIIGLGNSFNTSNEVVEPNSNINYYHQTVLAGMQKDKGFLVNDSLRGPLGTGDYYLDFDYPILSAYELTKEMPINWKELQAASLEKDFSICLNHYGMPRDIMRETFVAGEMVRAFQAFKNDSVFQAAGKFWTVYVNAITYGRYSLEYYRLGIKWMPGDVINDCYHWRRAGEHLFDFNKQR
jgi:hypothetical protein